MTKIQETELKQMSKRDLISEIKGLYAFVDYLMEDRYKSYPIYYYYPPFHPDITVTSSSDVKSDGTS